MNKLSKNHFWEWFIKNNKEYLDLEKKSKKEVRYWMNEMNAHLRAYYKFLQYSLSIDPNKKTGTLIISVDGNAMYFRRVDDLVAKAPAIPGWTVKALEDPMPIDFTLNNEIAETGADPQELSFLSVRDKQPLSLMVYHPLYTEKMRHEFYELARTAIYNLLGERSFGTDIRDIEVANLSYADPDEVQKIDELPNYIGALKSSLIVDGNGLLFDLN
jgi:hypothetical protein